VYCLARDVHSTSSFGGGGVGTSLSGSIILLGSQYLPARRVHLGQCGTDGVESDEPVRFDPCIMVAPGAEFIRPGAESVAGSGAVTGDRQPPPVPWRHRGDRRIHPPVRWSAVVSDPALPLACIAASVPVVLSQ
jgi:hypothetical protein